MGAARGLAFHIFNGKRQPEAVELRGICEALGVDLEEILAAVRIRAGRLLHADKARAAEMDRRAKDIF
ncbi:hypothetical protein ATY41_05975 [Leifsonia xyli subsp. xyli]|uniref:HTH cro/C1-type domain-containing protein n=2 Tax=Leifsonia xyli subsp. xyli TaxID=59736 RepID=Q6AEM8_LEIXX|nr:hypothetical protein [Leifsonia xyli]AAT89168.1 hypothetical protein Lxx13380 [Leifsonia xyli subsp. xyli str. CTCB07]ODA89448.1 hypothetical protein ATY41_05975 [Leifsonia xyli subsp. xyli]